MKRFFSILCFLFIVMPGAYLRCSLADLAGGGTIETTNGRITGRVVFMTGSPAPGTLAKLIPSQYDPLKDAVTLPFDTTDSTGRYVFSNVASGDYTIQFEHPGDRTRAFVNGVPVVRDTVTVPDITLQQPGAIKVMLPGSADTANGYTYIPGTTIAKALSGSVNFVVLDSVPAATITGVYYSTTIGTVSTAIRYSVLVTPGDTAVIFNPDWKYARRLVLNTSAAGAGVQGDLYDFPVLVRLTAATFTFARAKAGGADLRFTKADNTFLPHEIEQWDSAGSVAEIWAKVDTVFGNDSTQCITMYWGNPGADDSSSGAAVFDTGKGFAGAWHLCENGDSIHDATGNAFNGENSGTTASLGMIGNSRNFTDGDYIRVSGLLNNPEDITLSAWVRSDTSKGSGQEIVSIGDAVLIRFDDIYGIGAAGFYHNSPIVNDTMYSIVSSGRYLAKTGWHFLAFSIDTAAQVQTFYIDGVQYAGATDVNPINYAGLGADTYIGIHGNGKTTFNFMGQIDEVRVNNNAVTADWVKLCYMNQKAQDALIKW
ncbi:MAG: DUF2341 domain-containing protein [Chitinispirillaceae bacterium]|nr:DUF2341 domain-containing protein [Chitinispirillaceae bacterium]